MAARTSAAAGNWSTPGTWTGGLIPGNGDTATITHDVTVSANQIVGTSPASGGATAITVNTGGKLTINTGVTLTCRGDIRLNGTTLQLNAGSTFKFDASQFPTTPLSQHYLMYFSNSTSSLLTVNGTAGSRCTILSDAAGGNGSITRSGGDYWVPTVRYCDFTRIGYAGVPAIEAGGSYANFDLEQCVFDGGGLIQISYLGDTQVFRLVNVTMKNTLSTYSVDKGGSNIALTSGTRVIQGCVFDKPVYNGWLDFTVSDTLFEAPSGAGPALSAYNAGRWASFSGNFITPMDATETAIPADVVDCYFLHRATGNPHYFQPLGNLTVRGTVFEYTGTTDEGDCGLIIGAGLTAITFEHNIGLQNGSTGHCGTICSLLGQADTVITVKHNTWYIRDQSALTLGETYAGHAGGVAAFRDNLIWALPGATAYKVFDMTSTVVDVLSAANAHHNAGYNVPAGNRLKGYHDVDFSSGSPGASDVDGVDPQFVDSARDITKWDASLAGGGGAVTHALAELRKRNEAGYNAAYNIAALVTYVKAGFVPQAAAMQAASDSVAPSTGWIGALQGSVVTPPPSGGGWVFIDSTRKSSLDAEDVTTDPMDTSLADFLVAGISMYGDAPNTTMQDSLSNTWIPLTAADNGGTVRLQLFYAEHATVGLAHTFTTVCTSTNLPTMCVAAFSGGKVSGAFDDEGLGGLAGTDVSAASLAAGLVTPTQDNELVIAAAFLNPNFAITGIAPAGFTIVENGGTPSLAFAGALAYQIQTAATPVNPTWTFSGATYCGAVAATFKAEPVSAVVDPGELTLLGVG